MNNQQSTISLLLLTALLFCFCEKSPTESEEEEIVGSFSFNKTDFDTSKIMCLGFPSVGYCFNDTTNVLYKRSYDTPDILLSRQKTNSGAIYYISTPYKCNINEDTVRYHSGDLRVGVIRANSITPPWWGYNRTLNISPPLDSFFVKVIIPDIPLYYTKTVFTKISVNKILFDWTIITN